LSRIPKDLIREFELKTQQEIKNYHDVSLATNLSINKVNERLDTIRNSFGAEIEHLKSMMGKKDLLYQQIREEMTEFKGAFASFCSDFRKLNERDALYREQFREALEKIFKMHEQLNTKSDKSVDSYLNAQNEFQKTTESFRHEVLLLRIKMAETIKKMKQEILDIPSEAKEVESRLSSELEMVRVDKEGVLREVAVLKRALFISEKYIEDLYTQIKRLKETR